MRIALVSLFAAAACTSPRRSATTKASPRNYPAPLYAGLFQMGAHYTYTFEAKHSHWDDQDPRADKHGNVEEAFTGSMTCTVADVRELPSAVASRIECLSTDRDPMVGDAPAGIYVATAHGLWSVPEIPRVAPTTTTYRLFAWPLAASTTDEPDAKNPGFGTNTVIAHHGGGTWCRYFTFIAGDEGDEQMCLRDGIIVSGAASSAGGSTYEMSYALAKP